MFINLVMEYPTFEDMIDATDAVYIHVCQTVESMDGTVNKATLFDKDLSVLIVFGLRGFKHQFASQVALKCAYMCLEQLKPLNYISSVSAGVTTGYEL